MRQARPTMTLAEITDHDQPRRIRAGIAAILIGLLNVGILITVFLRRASSVTTRWSRSREWLQIR